MARERRLFSEEFKREAVKLVGQPGASKAAIARDLGIGATKGDKRKTWGVTSVSRLLGNRAVLGEYQPWSIAGSLTKRTKSGPVVPGYYPQIVELDLFNRVQDAIASRLISKTKKQAKHFNLWHGIGVCAGCGATLCLNTKGVSRLDPNTPLTYLICSNREKGMCQETGVRLDASEAVFLEILATTGNLSLVQDDIALQESQLQAARGRRIAEQERLNVYLKDYKATGSNIIANLMAEQERKVLDTDAEIARLEALLAANTVIDRQSFFERVNLSNRAARNQANALLKRLGIKVAIKKAGSRAKLACLFERYSESLASTARTGEDNHCAHTRQGEAGK